MFNPDVARLEARKELIMTEKTLDTPYAHFEIADGVLFVSYKKGLKITSEIAQEIIQTRLAFCGDKAYPGLVLDHGVLEIDKKARDIFSSEKGIFNVTASALVLRTTYSRIIGNFFLLLTRPAIPVRIFNDKAKALEWLNQYKTKESNAAL